MNAMAHAVESLYGPDLNPVVEGLAAKAVALLGGSLPRIVDQPGDIAARTDALYGAWLAARSVPKPASSMRWRSACGRRFGLDHSHCHAIFTPYAIAFNAKAAPRAMELIARGLGVKDAGRGLYDLNVRIGLPTGLKDLGMSEADIPKAVDIVAAGKFVNPRPVSRDDLVNLITQAFTANRQRFEHARPGVGAFAHQPRVRDLDRARASDHIADALAGARAHGPAQCSVTGVEPEIANAACGRDTEVRRRGRPQTGPERRPPEIAGARKQVRRTFSRIARQRRLS